MTLILAAVDFAAPTDAIVATAARLARAMVAEVRLVHVAEPEPAFVGYQGGPDAVRDQVAAELHRKRHDLDALADRLRAQAVDTSAQVIQGVIVDTILELAAKYDAELIVVGSHGRGAVMELLVGSVSEGVIRRSACPVVVVPVKMKATH